MASPVFIPGYTYWLSRLLDIRSTTGHHWLSPGIPLLALIMNWSRWMIVTPPKIGSFTRTTQLPTSDMHRNVAHLRSRQTISPGSLSRVSLSFWALPSCLCQTKLVHNTDTHTGHRSGSRWSVEDDVHNSDHRPIITVIGNSNLTTSGNESTVKWNTNNVNWSEWASVVNSKLNEYDMNENSISIIDSEQQLDLTVSIFTNVVQQACDKCCSKYISKRARCDAWNKDQQLCQIISEQKRIYRKIRRSYNQLALQRYKAEYFQLRQRYRSRLQVVKSDAFNNHINGEGPVNCFQKVCRLIKNSGHMITKTIEGTSNPVESTTKLVNALFPSDDEEEDNDDQKVMRNFTSQWLRKNNNFSRPPPITTYELHNAIFKFQEGKAPGYDGISPKILKNLWLSCPEIVLAIYNKCDCAAIWFFENQLILARCFNDGDQVRMRQMVVDGSAADNDGG
ncbi:hypothetical protein DERF_006526 [Dermatophagoides farinae]|uniref:Uncharacterized protein n=1 Tax=Dermatophagoides farinae TaxID=6954 RepID=A0A922I7Y0_DERFA|nr:hypothetical protein DERF_006526 [Dermatophagoides farinae]